MLSDIIIMTAINSHDLIECRAYVTTSETEIELFQSLLLKPATPLTNGAINETLRQTLDISLGSVATHLRCGGIFSDSMILTVE